MTFIKYKGGKVLEIKRHSTSMISNDTQSQLIRTLDFAVLLIIFICIVVEEIKIFLNLSIFFNHDFIL
jgi:hypothetical protein